MATRKKSLSARRTKRPEPETAGDLAAATRVPEALETALSRGEAISVGVVNLLRSTLVTALVGAQDVGREVGTAAVTAVRGSIRAAYEIGGDLGAVTTGAIRGTVRAAGEIGGDLGGVARSASRGAGRATSDLGDTVSRVTRRAMDGTVGAADRIGTAAGRALRDTVGETVAGVRSLVSPEASRRPLARSPGRRRAGSRAARTGRRKTA